MTKKNFKELAYNLHSSKPDGSSQIECRQWELDILAVAKVCKQFNPKFDNDKFLSACGAEVGKGERS